MESANVEKTVATTKTGELVLLTGRHAGMRQPLGMPTTFIGREQGCDIRLNIDGIDPLHCLLIAGTEGVRIRDLNSASGTFVNGVRTEHLLLQTDDVLNIGPFQFRVELSALAPGVDPEREGLRIQTAAVAAQQTALDEEEIRLEKRKADLEQQEEQLAAHLAEKQRQAESWTEQAKAEHEALRLEKLEHEKSVADAEAQLNQTREDLARAHQNLSVERQRINDVYQRLRHRWQKHWGHEKEKYRRHSEQLDSEKRDLEQKTKAHKERDAALGQQMVRFNTERELAVRQMHDERVELRKDQDSWRKRRSLEFAALDARQCELDEVQLKLAQARQLLVQEKEAWERRQFALEKELHGLNNRILHQRIRVQEQTDEIARLETQRQALRRTLGDVTVSTEVPDAILVECDVEVLEGNSASNGDLRIAALAQLASDLADQRTALIEQYERLAQIHQAWHEERARAARDLEVLAEQLAAREHDLVTRQDYATAGEAALYERHAEIESARQEIAIYRSQLKTREEAMEADFAAQLDALHRKESLLEEQLASLAQIRNRWNNRRQEEIGFLQANRATLAREQSETNAQRADLFAKAQQLAEQERVLAEKSVAVEQYWQEISLRAKDPEAQSRVEGLRQNWLTLNGVLVEEAKKERIAAIKNIERLENVQHDAHGMITRLTRVEAELAEKQTWLDEREAVLKSKQVQIDDEQRKLDHLKKEPERQRFLLSEDAEAVAHVIFEERVPSPIDKAA